MYRNIEIEGYCNIDLEKNKMLYDTHLLKHKICKKKTRIGRDKKKNIEIVPSVGTLVVNYSENNKRYTDTR